MSLFRKIQNMSPTTQSATELLLVLCLVGCLFAGLQQALNRKPLQGVFPEINSAGARLYVASPIEFDILDQVEELWPRRFSDQRPVEAVDVPSLYLFVKKNRYAYDLLDAYDLEFARLMSLNVNSRQIHELKKQLGVPESLSTVEAKRVFETLLSKTSQDETSLKVSKKLTEDCSLLKQERAFRLFQATDAFEKPALSYLRNCRVTQKKNGMNPEAALVYFLDLTLAYERNDLQKVVQLRQLLKKLSLQAWDGPEQLSSLKLNQTRTPHAFTRWFVEMSFELSLMFEEALTPKKETKI